MASRNVDIMESPCKKFLTWASITDADDKIIDAGFNYWDKNKGDKGEKVFVKPPLKFALLNDDCVTFKGYNEKTKQGVWSNEVSKPHHEIKIKSKQGTVLQFKLADYKANKDNVEGLGAKYTKSVYIGVYINGAWEMWNLQLSGAALSGAIDPDNTDEAERYHGWFNFLKGFKTQIFSNMIVVDTFQLKKKGKNKFTIPIYEIGEAISAEDDKELRTLTDALDAYHKFYFSTPAKEEEKQENFLED